MSTIPSYKELKTKGITQTNGISIPSKNKEDGKLWVPLENEHNTLFQWSSLEQILKRIFTVKTNTVPIWDTEQTKKNVKTHYRVLFDDTLDEVCCRDADASAATHNEMEQSLIHHVKGVKKVNVGKKWIAGLYTHYIPETQKWTIPVIWTWGVGTTREKALENAYEKARIRLGVDVFCTYELLIKNKKNIEESVYITLDELKNFQQIFVHKSYTLERIKKRVKTANNWTNPDGYFHEILPVLKSSNETLEWGGDAILQLVSSNYLRERFRNYEDMDEGFLTKSRSKLVREKSLSHCSRWYEFDKYMIIDLFMDEWKLSRIHDIAILEDVFEAFISVLYDATKEQCEYNVISTFIIKTFESIIDIPLLIHTDDNFKEILMQYYHKNFNTHPTYSEQRSVEVIYHGVIQKKYTMAVHEPIGGSVLATAEHVDKKQAEQDACEKACKIYGIETFNYGSPFFM